MRWHLDWQLWLRLGLMLGRRLHHHLLMMSRHDLRNIVDADKLMPQEVRCGAFAHHSAPEYAVILRGA